MIDTEMLELLHKFSEITTADFPKPEFQLHPPWFLLPDAEKIDIPSLFWELEKTIEKHPELWWPGNKCVTCGELAVSWDQANGYRCEMHPGPPAPLPMDSPRIGYVGVLDGSGDYEHEWT